jgi:hypothetical protein
LRSGGRPLVVLSSPADSDSNPLLFLHKNTRECRRALGGKSKFPVKMPLKFTMGANKRGRDEDEDEGQRGGHFLGQLFLPKNKRRSNHSADRSPPPQ